MPVDEFIWIDWNLAKIDAHSLDTEEVEHAWRNGRVIRKDVDPDNGPYSISAGRCPSGRPIRIVWRYDVDRDGVPKVFVITAY